MKKLEASNLKKIYSKGKNEVHALDGVNIEIEPYKFTSIVGASGSGKSTLLHCLAGLSKPSVGEVYLDDTNMYTLSDDNLSKIRRQDFGFVFQSYNLIPVINVYDNIILPVSIDGKKVEEEYISNLIEKFGLKSQVMKFPNELSGGQQQRVAIARSLANKPSIVFADEPTGNLDSKTTQEVMDIFRMCIEELNQTLVMITHDYKIAETADRIITISDGKIIKDTRYFNI